MMEAARTSETLVNFYQTTRRYNPEDRHLRNNSSSLLTVQPCLGLDLLHRFLSSAFVFHPRILRSLRSFSALSSHLRLGLPALLVLSGLEKVNFLHGDILFAQHKQLKSIILDNASAVRPYDENLTQNFFISYICCFRCWQYKVLSKPHVWKTFLPWINAHLF
jgi:hypothetical protein